VHIAEEDTNFGFNAAEVSALAQSDGYEALTNVHVIGSGMASFTDNQDQIKRQFDQLKGLDDTSRQYRQFSTLSDGYEWGL